MAAEKQLDGERAREGSYTEHCFHPSVDRYVDARARAVYAAQGGTGGNSVQQPAPGIPNYSSFASAESATLPTSGSGLLTTLTDEGDGEPTVRLFVKRADGLRGVVLTPLLRADTTPVDGEGTYAITHYVSLDAAAADDLVLGPNQIGVLITVDQTDSDIPVQPYLRVAAGFYGIVVTPKLSSTNN